MEAETKNVSTAIEEAQNILNAAENKAEKIIFKAEQEFSSAKERGYAAGFAQGTEEVTSTALRLIEDTSSISDKLAEQAARLAIAIAEDVIGKAIELNPALVKNIALNALRESVVGSNITIIVNAEDLRVIEQGKTEIKKLASGSSIAIETDNNITRGGCVIRTDFGEVDSQIPTLLDMVKKKLELHE